MTKEDVLNYVMNTPENTNRRVLEDMIDELINSSSGGSDIFYATIEYTDTDSIEFTCDKTFDELKAAYEAGKLVFVKLVCVNNGKRLLEESSPISADFNLPGDEIIRFSVTQPAHVSPGEFVSQFAFCIYPDPADNFAEFYAFTGVETSLT